MSVDLQSFLAGGLAVLAVACSLGAVALARRSSRGGAWKRSIEDRIDGLGLRQSSLERLIDSIGSAAEAPAVIPPTPIVADQPPPSPVPTLISIPRIGATRQHRADAPHPATPATQQRDARFELIRQQARAGRSIDEIARLAGVPRAVAELVLKLQNRDQETPPGGPDWK